MSASPHFLPAVPSFGVTGLRVRTCNDDEMKPELARIPGLWERVLSAGLLQTDKPVFAVYSGYESDHTGTYDLTVGTSSLAPHLSLATTEIPTQGYLVFEAQAESAEALHSAVFAAWQQVWRFFGQSTEWRRSYSADFERYDETLSATLHIAVERCG
ncbi:GyrI-like domain-containing protein [Chitinimonas sp. BJB300]|uniref:GyrI-like domain-containing protein n=1 Tax=Chitinimonas sp. BJB300 TaxID=1559339 RepID=UPI000C0E4D2E|nr:effector binding domain-containing protein [Chitinimonas sp. BJB300]PHV11261.1 AraC family transcriptional regulator [Chitinimonas sp. BJB300]TSJ90791.1 AraC family transcriptional regulator [Chitinimonas sp. BJB300]